MTRVTPKAGRGIPPSKWRPKFLRALGESCNVTYSADRAGVERMTAYRHRDKDPEFAAAWDAALALGVAALEDEMHRRAFQGVDEPVFYKGDVCGVIRRYSDTLAIFLSKAHAPDKYREHQSVDVTTTGKLIVEVVYQGSDADADGDTTAD